jgi:hypothetical protein
MSKAIAILLCMLSAMTLHAQLPSASTEKERSIPAFVIVSGIQGGFIAAHREQMKHLQQGHSIGGFVQVLRQAKGDRRWHDEFNQPETGIDAFFLYTGNARQLGSQMGICYFANLPLNRLRHDPRKFRHWITLGIGPGYSTKTWDLETNRQADVIGSPLNAALLLAWNGELLNTSRIFLRGGLRITHYSNGAFTLPNLGTNNIALSLQAGWKSSKRIQLPEIGFHDVLPRKWSLEIGAAAGLQEVAPPTYPKQPVAVISMWMHRRHSWKASFTGGVDLMYKTALQRLFEGRDERTPSASEMIQAGIIAGYNLHFDRLRFSMQQGVYVRDKWKETGMLYHRFGLRYQITHNLFAHLMLKTHFAKADHGELGVGYTFSKR